MIIHIKRLLISLFVIIGGFYASNAQSLVLDDTQKTDSFPFYQNMFEFSKKNSFNKLIYDMIFRKPQNQSEEAVSISQLPYNYKDSEGKIIRNIIIVTRNPFNVDENDNKEGLFSKKTLNKVGNIIHTNSRPFVLKNLLLFKEKEKFDSLRIQESERLVRRQRYVEKSVILGINVENTNDSVDVVVVVRDKLSIYPEVELSSSRFGLGLKEINLAGMGHQAHVFYSWNYSGGVHDYQYDYKIPNILNTYINTGILYKRNKNDSSEIKQFFAERPFYSPLAKWAGGITIMQQSQKYNVNIPYTDEFITQFFKYNIMDFWGAYAFNLKNRNALKARTRKLVLSARYYYINYLESPLAEYDPLNVYSKENLYLLSIGVSQRKYKKDSYLFRFGFTEDVPIGYNYSIMGGIQHKNQQNRLYLGAKLSSGNYFKPGYFSGALEYGSFFDGIDIKEGVFAAEFSYITPLLELGRWKFRQFVKPQYMIGINRLKTDRLSLEDYFGINGFNSNSITGTQKLVCNFQTQAFAPWNIWGFKLAPYFIYSMGMLGNQKNGFMKSKVYSLFGLGFLVRNDNLVFNSFEVSVSFYPYIPENGHNIFKFNAYEASDFKFRDFDVKKPELVIYK